MDLNGLLIINKPAGLTSHDVVDRIRKQFSIKRVGHLGTLDPMATGVLLVCLGKATRLGRFIPGSPKEYTGEIRFGFSTITYDSEGQATGEPQPFTGSEDTVRQAMRQLTGPLNQVPPPFSAKKIGGVPAYRLARRGKPVEVAPSRVEVFEFEMAKFDPLAMQFRVSCSPGTYIRSLAHDLGGILGCGAHLKSLVRTRSGEFMSAQAIPLDRVTAADVIPIENLLESWPRVDVSDTDEQKVRHGNQIPCEAKAEFARIFNKRGEFLAVAAIENGWGRPRLVLTSNTSD
jgi:tRNA pseudouridine55 synthase